MARMRAGRDEVYMTIFHERLMNMTSLSHTKTVPTQVYTFDRRRHRRRPLLMR
jgi:hypothetical protein